MPIARHPIHLLLELPRTPDLEARRALWRQGFAALAQALTHRRPLAPLEGAPRDHLEEAVQLAFDDGLFDEIGWLSGPAAAAALYELADALPPSPLQRELGRKVLHRLRSAEADTFAALATRLALGARRALHTPSIRARVALALELPFGAAADVDPLALALVSRKELQQTWLLRPAHGALPERRLAARLLERAAREAARRDTEGDDAGLRILRTEEVQRAWRRLLDDRESLVWRHAAAARGLLSEAEPSLREEIDRHLDPTLGPTEWRRAAAALGARIAVAPEEALAAARAMLASPLVERDEGVAAALLLGLPRAADAEPQAVEALLEQAVRVGGLSAAEALVELRRERPGEETGPWAAQWARAHLREQHGTRTDTSLGALLDALDEELAPEEERPTTPLRERLATTVSAFAQFGPATAAERAMEVLQQARERLDRLERLDDRTESDMLLAFRLLRELDGVLCETDALFNLLWLRPEADHRQEEPLPGGELHERLSTWLLAREAPPVPSPSAVTPAVWRMRRLRTLLHRIDADGPRVDADAERLASRRRREASVLLFRLREEPPNRLRRALNATVARACDALLREEHAEAGDVLLWAALHVERAEDLRVLAEASMVPELERIYMALAHLSETHAQRTDGAGLRLRLDALSALAHELPIAASPRVEALRRALLDLTHAIERIAAAGSLTEIAEERGGGDRLDALESALAALARLARGALSRLHRNMGSQEPLGAAIEALGPLRATIRRLAAGHQETLADALRPALQACEVSVPAVLAEPIRTALGRLERLPPDRPRSHRSSFLPSRAPRGGTLPAWMPPSRVLGGFYVLHVLGSGAVGSVFAACRAERRRDPHAERFALKVPEYDAATARTLSEAQFLELFREEAGALLALPRHPNLPRFVTFDAEARPKPILVMELVEGPSLERVLSSGELSVTRALDILEDIATGLRVMHRAGLGHLDLKPANVILRRGEGEKRAVLVDFGLAGRHVRPGCGTAEYGAPELWTGQTHARNLRPQPVDVYAFGCLAFEVLTGRELFRGHSELELIAQHHAHDGLPPAVGALLEDPRTTELATMLRKALRRAPEARAPIEELRLHLSRLREQMAAYGWPLPVPTPS